MAQKEWCLDGINTLHGRDAKAPQSQLILGCSALKHFVGGKKLFRLVHVRLCKQSFVLKLHRISQYEAVEADDGNRAQCLSHHCAVLSKEACIFTSVYPRPSKLVLICGIPLTVL